MNERPSDQHSEETGGFSVLPPDDEVTDLLLERNPRLIEECRLIYGRMEQGEYLTHEQMLAALEESPAL
jgi:hypothetical protein